MSVDPDPYRLCLDPDPYRYSLEPDPYQSSVWIRIRNEFFQILDPNLYQNDTDPQHWFEIDRKANLPLTENRLKA